MVKVSVENRHLRPFEILPISKTETNPFKKSKALITKSTMKSTKIRRIRNDALIRELKKQREKPKIKDQSGRGVEFKGADGERIKGIVVRMSDNNDGAMFVEYILNNKRYEERMTMEDVTFLETTPKLVINKTKRVIVRKEVEEDDDTKEIVKYINSQKLLAVKTEHEDKFWLAKPVGQVRRAVVEDDRRSGGTVKAGNWFITAKWYENSDNPRTYYLSNGNNYLSIDSVYIVKDLKFETVDTQANKFMLSVRDRNRILKFTTTENQKKEKPIRKTPISISNKVMKKLSALKAT